ncbi:MAG: DUF1830 domain-containing protein [Cyanobacteria bacterium]|nr:DUF1830 domain-containing protein [Cyanobacteriota bacterium]MDA0864993.1 DUF1830 domain-containing protein [Cyanobacteriota bacterium]
MPSLDALPIAKAQVFLCGYRNETSAIQVIRITNIADWYFERVVFPGAWLLFEAVSQAQLEVYSGDGISTLLADHIPCHTVQVMMPTSSIRCSP